MHPSKVIDREQEKRKKARHRIAAAAKNLLSIRDAYFEHFERQEFECLQRAINLLESLSKGQ